MKFNRFSLVAGVLALGVAACGDDVEIVQPTPEPPPPPPPVTATMAPASASVAVGNSVVFAVNASGGVAGDAASWTCASSNTGIATVTSTSAGCSATGVAAGDVTITASVSKSGETVNVGAQLTVTTDAPPDAGDPAFILISSIEGEGGPGASALSGRVNVEVSVERGDATLEQLSVLVDGEVVASQSFGTSMGMSPEAEDAAAEQAVHEFTFSFDSDAYEPHGDHTDVAYMNGEHTISAELQVAGGMMADGMMGHETISSNVITVEFDNDDGFVVSADLGDASALDGNGRRWYGGPANGHIAISALPVIYSGEEIGEVTISLADCEVHEEEEGDGDDHGHGDDDHGHAAEASFEFDCTGEDHGRAIIVSVGGVEFENVLNKDDLPEANIDMEGPAVAPYFSPNPNNREDGWVNLTVNFLGDQGPGSKKDGWLDYNEADDEPGVGGYQPVLRYAAQKDGVKGAIAAAPLSLTNLPSESAADAYCAVVSVVDALGNESDLPDANDGTCPVAGTPDADAGTDTDNTTNDATGYEMLLEALAMANRMDDDVAPATTKADAVAAAQGALANAGIRAGVDITPPGIEIDEMDRINTGDPSMDFDVYDDEHDDHNSGLHSLPLLASVQMRDTDDAGCLDISDDVDGGTAGDVGTTDDDCDDATALASGTALDFTGPANAYYTVSGRALDKAGNYSMVASHTFVFDDAIATATPPAAPRIDAGDSFQVASFLNDDLSIRDYYVTANFAATGTTEAIRLGVVHPTPVDAFDADPLTYRNHAVNATVDTYTGLQENPAAATVTTLTGVSVAVRDQADSDGTNDGTPATTAVAVLDAADVDDGFEDEFAMVFAADTLLVCAAEDEDDCADDNQNGTVELEVVATATELGAFSNPFERVEFWVRDVNGASWMLGSDTSGDSGRVSSSNRRRTWTYSLDASAADLHMLTREAAFPPSGDTDSDTGHRVLAFAVNDDGIALVDEVTLTIDDGDDEN